MKKIIPHKLVVSFNPDGGISSSILQYQIDIDGKVEGKFYTMSVKAGIDLDSVDSIALEAKTHVETGEKVKEVNSAEVKLKADLEELAVLKGKK